MHDTVCTITLQWIHFRVIEVVLNWDWRFSFFAHCLNPCLSLILNTSYSSCFITNPSISLNTGQITDNHFRIPFPHFKVKQPCRRTSEGREHTIAGLRIFRRLSLSQLRDSFLHSRLSHNPHFPTWFLLVCCSWRNRAQSIWNTPSSPSTVSVMVSIRSREELTPIPSRNRAAT